MSGFLSPTATPRKRGDGPTTPGYCNESPNDTISTPKRQTQYRPKPITSDIFDTSPKPLVLPAVLLPTPSTVGSGRVKKADIVNPSRKSRNLTACLQALANDEPVRLGDFSPGLKIQMPASESPAFHEQKTSPKAVQYDIPAFNDFARKDSLKRDIKNDTSLQNTSEVLQLHTFPHSSPTASLAPPSTPPQLALKQEPFFEDVGPEDKEFQIMHLSDVEKIPRRRLSNPFLETMPRRNQKPGKIDLSENIELINHTTGERRIERMSEEQKRFKPRKLNFGDVTPPMRLNFNVTNNYIGRSMGKNFAMQENSTLAPGFDIYDDNSE